MQPHIINLASKSFSPFLKKDTSDENIHFLTLLISFITRKYYTKICIIHWSSYHDSSAKLVQPTYNGVRSPRSNAKVIEILRKIYQLLC